jgi:hypothetical protein
MHNPARKRRATRPVPLAVLGLMFGILGMMYQVDTVYYAHGLEESYLLWVIGFAIVAWATWGQHAEPSMRHDDSR